MSAAGVGGGSFDRVQSPFSGIFHRRGEQDYALTLTELLSIAHRTWKLVTLDHETDELLFNYKAEKLLTVWVRPDFSGV